MSIVQKIQQFVKQAKPTEIPVSCLDAVFFVREAISEERVQMFKALFHNNASIPPLWVIPSNHAGRYTIVDGRTRFQGAELAAALTVSCIVLPSLNQIEQYLVAWSANAPDGALPPNDKDKLHFVRMLMRLNMSRAELLRQVSELSRIPTDMALQLVTKVEKQLQAEKLNKAYQDVLRSKMTIEEAAEHYHVNLRSLQERMGVREKVVRTIGPGTLYHNIKEVIKSANLSIGQQFADALARVRGGQYGEEGIAVIEKIRGISDELLKAAQAVHKDRDARAKEAIEFLKWQRDHPYEPDTNNPHLVKKKRSTPRVK